MKKADLWAYAHAYLSFLLPRVKTKIKEIILFGSVARGDFDQQSDIDLFFDLITENDAKGLADDLKIIDQQFYKGKVYELWKQKGLTNIIKAKMGVLENWELKNSIIAEGITLHGMYKSEIAGEGYMLISFSPIKKIAKRNRVMRGLFGREGKGGKKEGMIAKVGGLKAAPTVFLVPLQFSSEIISFLRKEKVDIQLREMWSAQKK